MTNSRTALAALIVLGCAGVEARALLDRGWGEPRNRDIRRYVIGEIYDEHRVEQRFAVKADGLSSITIHPRPASPSPTGTVILEVRDITGSREGGDVIQRVETPLPALAQQESFTIAFEPQPSADREYALEVRVEGGSDGQGIGLLAARGDGYRRGTLFVNGRPRYGDLVFATSVSGAASSFASMASALGDAGVPLPRLALLIIWLVKAVALFLVIHLLARAAATPPAPAHLPAPLP